MSKDNPSSPLQALVMQAISAETPLTDETQSGSVSATLYPKRGTLRIIVSRGTACRPMEGRRDRRADRVFVHDGSSQNDIQRRLA